jgi:lipid A ethanolaminephosphotransferase
MFRRPRLPVSSNLLIVGVACFLVAFCNYTLFGQLFKAYPFTGRNIAPLLALPLALVALTVILVAPWCFGRSTKFVLGTVLVLSSFAAHFMDAYGVVISDDMLRNVLQTNTAEALDLMTWRLAAYAALLGGLPALLVARLPVRRDGLKRELVSRLKLLALAIAVLVGVMLAFGSFMASMARQNKELRSYVNPSYYLYSAVKLARAMGADAAPARAAIVGADARRLDNAVHRELVILVVGETARADRFSINGYKRETNPRLQKEAVISFTDFHSCGTSTGISVPCMFSMKGEAEFDEQRARREENVLDIAQRAGTYVLWRDNNYDSKGVADRVNYENFRGPDRNPVCDEECRDEGMLAGLQEVIDARPTGDILIVLHQMGNHGPAYYKRYPPAFEVFKPVCRSSDLSTCTEEEIGNAYDNAIRYTDDFLGKVIDLLKRNDPKFATAMFYLSDHGESLGEKGTFLHGLPKSLAPVAQVHVPAIMWFGAQFKDVDRTALERIRTRRFTHDNLPHTLLGLLEVRAAEYRPDLDIVAPAEKK